MELVGRSGSRVLFSHEDTGIVVDESANLVLEVGTLTTILASSAYPATQDVSGSTRDLAEAAVTSLNIDVIGVSDRMHTIPKAVQLEAKRGLDWFAQNNTGATPAGLETARILASGGQIGIRKIRHIARYFPRHEFSQSEAGFSPNQDGYPSSGRISWALWGGSAAQKWARNIVERENKTTASLTAGLPVAPEYVEPVRVDTRSFSKNGSEFIIRVRRDSDSVDRLYQIEANGQVFVWDDGCWDDLGHINHDIDTYDKSLDDPYDTAPKEHVPVDSETAIIIAALMDADPLTPKALSDISPLETELVEAAMDEIDWAEVDAVLAAGDGKYTPEERAKNASSQVRDGNGRFAQTGSRVVVGGDPNYSGKIVNIDPTTKSADVELDNGKTINVPVSRTAKEGSAVKPASSPGAPASDEPALDTSGILGEPRKNVSRAKATLPENMPVLSKDELHDLINNFPAEVSRQRGVQAAGDQSGDIADPNKSDVPPVYLAIVDQNDVQAVMDLVALVPANSKSTTPITFTRAPGKWERDDAVLQDLNSPTPPPVVKLDEAAVKAVLEQIDSMATNSIAAAGGLDRNRGNAEKLRRYWVSGEGAAKIRWNTGGDWKRCVRYLSKHMGPRAKGYCALRHKEATGLWTGDKLHRKLYGRTASGEAIYSNDYIASTEQIITDAILNARAAAARSKVLTAGASQIAAGPGARFVIPLVIPEEVESGDGRIFEKDAITIRELPLPLMWQIQTADGHQGSVVVGRIDHMERIDGGIGNARGVFDTGPYGKEAERLVRGGFIRGVSADMDKFEGERETEDSTEHAEGEEPTKVETGRMVAKKGRVMGVTLVAKPAFQECFIAMDESEQEDNMVPDGIYVEDVDPLEASALVACGIVSSMIPAVPPREWFDDPKLKGPTPLTVDDSGRVFGHVAAWHVDHIGMAFGTKPPRSRSKYSYFHTGVVRTDDGSDVPVGQLTLAGGHASLEASAQEAVRHYDDTASAIADVHAGEDAYGIWVAGALRPGATPEQIRALRASAPSGDWRPIKGHLEMVAVLQVNVPGFPTARARVASGQVLALVAAGASTLARMKSDPLEDLNTRISRLENEANAPLVAAANEAKSKVAAAQSASLERRRNEIAARMRNKT